MTQTIGVGSKDFWIQIHMRLFRLVGYLADRNLLAESRLAPYWELKVLPTHIYRSKMDHAKAVEVLSRILQPEEYTASTPVVQYYHTKPPINPGHTSIPMGL